MKGIILIITILFSISITFSKSHGWIKDSMNKNDAYINKAYQIIKLKILEGEFGSSEEIRVYPVAVYKQLGNGLKYKFIIALKNEKLRSVSLLESEIYTVPFSSENYKKLNFEIKGVAKLRSDLEAIENLKLNIIKETISNYNLGAELQSITSIHTYNKIINEESYFVVSGEAKAYDGNIVFTSYVIVQNEDGTFNVDRQIKF